MPNQHRGFRERVALKPSPDTRSLVSGEIVEHDVDGEARRGLLLDGIEKLHELDAAMP
jgi:hypothetical protein